jgi:hypothetical protein
MVGYGADVSQGGRVALKVRSYVAEVCFICRTVHLYFAKTFEQFYDGARQRQMCSARPSSFVHKNMNTEVLKLYFYHCLSCLFVCLCVRL